MGPESQRALKRAIEAGDLETVRDLLADGVFPGHVPEQTPSPIDLAVDHGHAEILRLLLDAGADPRRTRDAVLHRAAEQDSVAMVEMLSGAGLPVDEDCDGDGTALNHAAAAGALRVARLLVERGADLHLGSPLESAAREGHGDMVDYLKPHYPPDAQRRADALLAESRRLQSIPGIHRELVDAAFLGDLERVERLLASGAPADAITVDSRGNTNSALQLAVAKGHLPVVERLLEAGANPDGPSLEGLGLDRSRWGEPPLLLAIWRGDLETTDQLLRAGAQTHTGPGQRFTDAVALTASAHQLDPTTRRALVRRLVAAGAEPGDGPLAE